MEELVAAVHKDALLLTMDPEELQEQEVGGGRWEQRRVLVLVLVLVLALCWCGPRSACPLPPVLRGCVAPCGLSAAPGLAVH